MLYFSGIIKGGRYNLIDLQTIVSINLFPIIGLVFFLFFIWGNSHLEKKVRNSFITLAALIFIDLMIYNIQLYLESLSGGYRILLTLITSLGYSIRPILMYYFIRIVLRNDDRKRVRLPLLLPAIINIGIAFTPFIPPTAVWVFYYDNNHIFHRGPLGFMTHIISIIYLWFVLMLSYSVINKKKSFERLILFAISITMILGMIGETIIKSPSVLRCCIVGCLIFYYMYFQSERYRDDIIGKHIEQVQMSERLSLQMVSALARTVDAKDSYTNGHSERVAHYSKELARRLGKDEAYQRDIFYMGLLHDIGKIGIPDTIINKTAKLTDDEFSTIKSHPEIGAEVLQDITEMPNLYYGARWHHERYDGSGYPDGLRGDQIPIEARIIAVADVYDAMTSKRSYRDVLPQNVVRAEIERAKRTQIDPFIANIMLEMIDEDKDYNMKEQTDKKYDYELFDTN